MTRDRALSVLRARRRTFLRRRWTLRVGFAATILGGLWLWLPRPVGLDLGTLPVFVMTVLLAGFVTVALLAGAGMLGDRFAALVNDGSTCRDVDALAPAVVVAAGSEGVAVRLGNAPDAPGDRWWWEVARGQQPVPVGQPVWVDAHLDHRRRSPIVWLADGTQLPRVLWPATSPVPDAGTRVRLQGRDGRPIAVGDAAPPELLEATRAAARTTVIWCALWLGLLVVMTPVALALDLRARPSGSGSVLSMVFVLNLISAVTFGGPRLVAAWPMWRARGLRRAVLAERRTDSPFVQDAGVTVLVAPPDGAGSSLWGWTLFSYPPTRKDLREVWLADSARPGRLAALVVPARVDGKPLILYPGTVLREVTDPALQVTT